MNTPRVPDLLPSGEPQSVDRLELAPEASAARDARQFVQSHAPALPLETQDALLLLTSELVTNAVLHARTQIDLELVVAENYVAVTVHDLNLALPNQDPYSAREGGWGLALVTSLAPESSMYVHPEGGKTAWFRLRRGPAPAVADDAAARDERRSP